MLNMRGYLSGLSSPSGTLRIMAFFTAPVSNSAGHTRLPTFSMITRSRFAKSKASSPFITIPASRWQNPPVLIWTAGMPASAIFSASTMESMSASSTPIRNLFLRCSMVLRISVVLPAPGELMRFRRKVFCPLSLFLRSSASFLLSERISSLISISLISLITAPPCP